MDLFVLIQIIIGIFYVGYLVWRYALPQVHIGVKVSVYFTWLLCFSVVILLPLDIYYRQPDSSMVIAWRILYAFISILTWILLPIAQQYQTAGQFTPLQKLKRAILNNLIIYGIFGLIGGAFLAYFLFFQHFNLQKWTQVLITASNAFGMFLIVIFLSYGLVKIPKQLWRQKNYQMKLKQNQFSASVLSKKKEGIIHELQLKAKEVFWHQKSKGDSPQVVELINLIPEKFRDKWRRNPPNLGEVDIVKAHKDIKQYTLQLNRLESRWQQLLYDTFRIEDILADINSTNYRIQSTLFPQTKYGIVNLMIWLWYCRLKGIFSLIASIIVGIFAACVIIAQISSFFKQISFLNPFSWLAQGLFSSGSFLLLDTTMMIILSYISFCVYYALFKLKFASFYGLYWNQQTDSASLIFFAINCSRVCTPLCYNFLQLIQNQDPQKTSFSKVMGTVSVGQTINILFPVLLIILILFNTLDVYSRLSKTLGMQQFQFQPQFQHQNIEQGKRLLRKARTDIETKILNNNGRNLSDFRSYKSQLGEDNEFQISKDNFSSDTIKIKPIYFNQYPDMNNFVKILDM